MKIKKLLALALAGTMVFSMTACGDKEDKASEGGKAKSTESTESTEKSNNSVKVDDVSVETVIEKFDEFTKNQDTNYSAETYIKMKMSAAGMEMDMEMTGISSSYDGVTYTKSSTNMFGEVSEDEEYTITQEDGSIVTASKSVDDDEWDVYTMDADDEEESAPTLDLEKIKKTAKMETKGDNCIVTMEVDAEDLQISDDEMFEGAEDMTVKVIVTYNAKEDAITEMEVEFDMDVLSEAMSALGDIEIDELEMKVTNIKKNTKPIEIPSEIELD